jgi:hypothetical protein
MRSPQLTAGSRRPYCAIIPARMTLRATRTAGDAMDWIVCCDVGRIITDVFVAAPLTIMERARATWSRSP